MAKTRLLKELKSKNEEFSLDIVNNDLMHWQASINPADDSPYAGGVFMLDFRVPDQYPFMPPRVRFNTRIFHPNIHFESGEICLDVLKNDWSPAWSLESICRAILALLSAPNADSPLNCDAGNMIRAGDMKAYNSMARMYTVEFAFP